MAESDVDLVVVGAGPAGLTAAVYAAREGLNTVVLDRSIVGGLAAVTDQIDNYPGFPDGIVGAELAERLDKQARRFGAQIRTFAEVTDLETDNGRLTVRTTQDALVAKAVIIAAGSTYRQLGVPGEAEQIGKHVHFCATCDGPLYRDRELVAVGGGNSAVQESLFLAKFARRVTLLVRGEALKASAVLVSALERCPNVTVAYNVSVTAIESAAGKLTGVSTHNAQTGETGRYDADGVFVFIGLLASTAPFVGHLAHDERNFLITDQSYGTAWPGVFVAGDVRSGSTWQIASAVGEGAAAALAVRRYLDGLVHATIDR